jgi:hypothetical protein
MGVAFVTSLLLGKLVIRWVFYLLLLVFLGGVMVVLSFIVSVCANEKFFYHPSGGLGLLGALLIGLLLFKVEGGLETGFRSNRLGLPLYQLDRSAGFILLMVSLVVCLVSVVRVRKVESGPLVKRL